MPPRHLPDRLRPGVKILLVGINPGPRSAALGHHFAGRGNRFWDLLFDSGLSPRRLGYEEDALLPDLGIGLTNIAARPTRSSADLHRRDYERGRRALRRKIAALRLRCVAFVGVTAYREFRRGCGKALRRPGGGKVRCGLQPGRLEGAAVFVLPNPSGRNAHFRYRDMLRHYRALARRLAGDR